MYRHIFALACILHVGRCFPDGFVTSSCKSMTPNHHGSIQTGAAPFTVTADRSSYAAGEMVTVQLQADSTKFKGFMLQAREVGGKTPVGSFNSTDEQIRLLTCGGALNSAMAHSSSIRKTSILGTWTAPTSGSLQDIEFRVSFVINFSTYWVQVLGPLLTFRGGESPPVTPTPTPTSSSSSSSSGATPPPLLPPVSISSAGCGTRKVCLSRPHNCDPAVNTKCYFMSAMASSDDTAVLFELTGPSQGYLAVAFSDDKRMGNDDIYICGLDTKGFAQLQHAHSTGRFTPEPRPLGDVSGISAFIRDGVIGCSFTSRNPIFTLQSSGFSTPFYLFLAHGLIRKGEIQFHSTMPFVSDEKVDITKPEFVNVAGRPRIIKAHGKVVL